MAGVELSKMVAGFWERNLSRVSAEEAGLFLCLVSLQASGMYGEGCVNAEVGAIGTLAGMDTGNVLKGMDALYRNGSLVWIERDLPGRVKFSVRVK